MRGRREFLRGLGAAGAVGLLGVRPGPAAAEPPPETTTPADLGCTDQVICAMGPIDRRGRLVARRRVHRHEVRRIPGESWSSVIGALASMRPISDYVRRPPCPRARRRRPHHVPGRGSRRLLRAVRDGTGSGDPGPEREDRRRDEVVGAGPRLHSRACWPRRSGSRRTSAGSPSPAAEGKRAACEGQGRCLPRISA